MSQAPIIFPNVTPTQFAQLQVKAQASGLPINGVSGSGSHEGVDFAWNYDVNGDTLTVTLKDKPLFVSWGFIEAKLKAAITAALDGGGE